MSTRQYKMRQMQDAASVNLVALTLQACTGLGVITGMSDKGGSLVLVCWKSDSDKNVRNSIFEYVKAAELVRTEVADFSKVEGPARPRSYNVMVPMSHAGDIFHIAGNGAHVDVIADGYAEDQNADQSIHRLTCESKKPRIVASCGWQGSHPETPIFKIDVVRRTSLGVEYHPHEVPAHPGFGRCFMTHYTNGRGERAFFEKEPFLLPLDGDANAIAETLWDTLFAATKVSLAVKVIPKKGPPDVVIKNWHGD